MAHYGGEFVSEHTRIATREGETRDKGWPCNMCCPDRASLILCIRSLRVVARAVRIPRCKSRCFNAKLQQAPPKTARGGGLVVFLHCRRRDDASRHENSCAFEPQVVTTRWQREALQVRLSSVARRVQGSQDTSTLLRQYWVNIWDNPRQFFESFNCFPVA